MEKLSEILMALRKAKGLTQKDAASQIGVTPSMLTNYEKGKTEPTLTTAQRIADFYSVSLDELCGKERENGSVRTQADVIRALLNLFESIDIQKQYIPTLALDGSNLEYLRLTFPAEYTWLTDFVKAWEKLKSVEESGMIGSDVVQAWVSEQLRIRDKYLPDGSESPV